MALSTQNANLVWQKVNIALQALGAKPPVTAEALKALKLYLSSVKGNPDLQYVALDATTVDDASGAIVADAPCKVYAVYGKKQATAPDVYLVILDDAADDTGIATDARIIIPFITSADEALVIYPKGLDMAAGVVAKAYTEFDGTTDSSSADTPNGFVILGAA